jgi:hypothetical protein
MVTMVTKKRQKTPKNISARVVIINAVKVAIGKDIY